MLINKESRAIKFRKWIVFIVYIVFILVVVESTTRGFFKITNQNIEIYRNFSFTRIANMSMPDTKLGYKLIPNVSRNVFTSDFQIIYTTNSLGLREKEIENTPRFKILFLGDSQTFGEGVPYGSRFSDLIEKEIDNVYSINTGVPGYGIHQMYQYLKCSGLNLKPNLVICAIIPVDLKRAIYKESKTPPHLLTRRRKVNDLPWIGFDNFLRFNKALLRHSYFYVLFRTRIQIWLMWNGLQERDRKEWEKLARQSNYMFNEITGDNQEGLIRETSFKIFHFFKIMLRNTQIEFLVVNIDKEPIPWLEDYFRQKNIDYLDVSPALKNATNITFKIDPHYTSIGNRIIADCLKAYILKRYITYISKSN